MTDLAGVGTIDVAESPKPKLDQNQYGGSFGGPLELPKLTHGKAKTFFFADYQGTRIATPAHP